MLKRHFSLRFFRLPTLAATMLLMILLFFAHLPFVLAEDADNTNDPAETNGDNSANGEEIDVNPPFLGGFTFEKDETVDRPNVFVSLDPEADEIVFEENAVLDADVPFVFASYEQWEKWHRETGADPDRLDEYDIQPISALTLGNAYKQIILEPGARIINRASQSDGMMVLGPLDMDIGEDAIVHGNWAAISLANFKEPQQDEYYEAAIFNRGRIGSFAEDPGASDADEDPVERKSATAILFYEGVGGSVVNEEGGAIIGQSYGIRTNYAEREGIFIPLPGGSFEIPYIDGSRISIDNHGEIHAGFDGIFEGGGLETVSIVNHESGVIEGGRTGILLSRSGDVDNRGTIKGGEIGIFVSSGTSNIIHSGVLAVTGEEGGDAIRYSSNAKGGAVTLLSGVDGDVRHLGDTLEASLSIGDTTNPAADFSVGNIDFGEGPVTQHGGTWTYKDITAGSLSLEGGEMFLDSEISIEQGIHVAQGAAIDISDGTVSAGNFVNRGLLSFHNGEIAVTGGVFDYAGQEGARDLDLSGMAEDQAPRLRLINGAGAMGIDHLSLGGSHAGRLTLEDAGTLAMNRLTVRDKGQFAGTGRVRGDVTVSPGGIMTPGYSEDPTGTLSIDGDLDIARGATVDIAIDKGDHNSSKIDVTGDLSIDGGTVKVIDLSDRMLDDEATYTFLTAGNPFSGGFDAIAGFSPVYDFSLDYGINSVTLNVFKLVDYTDYAQTPIQVEMARVYESARREGHLPTLVFMMERMLSDVLDENLHPEFLRHALDQISPEPYQAAYWITADQVGEIKRHLMNGARQSRMKLVTGSEEELAAMMRISAGLPGGYAPYDGNPAEADENARTKSWIHPGHLGTSTYDSPIRLFYGGFYRFAEVDADIGRTGYDYKNRGFYLGFERAYCSRIIGGGSIGYTYNYASFDNKRGNLEMDSFRLGPHITYKRNRLEIDVAVSGGVHLSRQQRKINFPVRGLKPGVMPMKSVSRFNIYDGTAYTDARYNLLLKEVWRLTPNASLQYTYQHRERAEEKRGGDIDLTIEKDSHEVLRSMLGLNISREIRGSSFVLVPSLYAGWRYDMLDREVDIEGRFTGVAAGEESLIRVTGQGPDRNSGVYGGTITALFGEYNMAYLGYEQELMDTGNVYTYYAGVKWNF